MQHVWEFMIEKNEGTEDMNPLTLLYVTESNRKNKVGGLVQRDVLKKKLVEQKDIKNIYLHQVR